jgi:hypothetical protein
MTGLRIFRMQTVFWPAVRQTKTQGDSKLLSGPPFIIHGKPDNKFESLCISEIP